MNKPICEQHDINAELEICAWLALGGSEDCQGAGVGDIQFNTICIFWTRYNHTIINFKKRKDKITWR